MTNCPSTIAGLRVTVQRHLCQTKFLRWARTHRRSRINKKWRKKYGPVIAPCPGFAFEIAGMGLLVCPCVAAKLKEGKT